MQVSSEFDFIPKVRIIVDDAGITYEQERISASLWSDLDAICKQVVVDRLARDLGRLALTGFVHGDIHARNLIFDGERLLLIDLEPSFRQIRHGKRVLMISVPRSTADRASRHPSVETDKIGFYLAAMKLLGHPVRGLPMYADRAERLRKALPCPERDFLDRPFPGVAKLAQEHMSKNHVVSG